MDVSLGLLTLMIVAALILLGVSQRVLDRLGLTDRQALMFTALIFVGGLIGDISLGERISINLGGAVVPIALCVYLFFRADTGLEKFRALLAAVVSALAVWLIGHYFPDEPETMPFDVNYLYGLAAGAIAYLFGRSRRSAFIGGVMGVVLADVAQAVVNWNRGLNQPLVLGGAGAVDTVVISGLTAVLLAEFMGELLERMSRGTDKKRALESGRMIRGEKRR